MDEFFHYQPPLFSIWVQTLQSSRAPASALADAFIHFRLTLDLIQVASEPEQGGARGSSSQGSEPPQGYVGKDGAVRPLARADPRGEVHADSLLQRCGSMASPHR